MGFRNILGIRSMITHHKPLPRSTILIPLLSILACVYLLVYSGRIESGDSLQLFDATNSLFRFQDWLLDESAVPLDEFHEGSGIETYSGDRLQPILAIPLYALAWAIPGLGLVQTTWLFNILVTLGFGRGFLLFLPPIGLRDCRKRAGSFFIGYGDDPAAL